MYNILIFGDSITFGRGVKKEKNWSSLIANYFDQENKYDFAIFNLGVPGESSKELLQRIEIECQSRCKKRSPDDYSTIVIAIGINDAKGVDSPMKFYTQPKEFSRNINSLIEIAKKYSEKIILIGLTPTNETKTSLIKEVYFLNKNIKQYNSIVEKICKEKRITFIEIFNDWKNNNYKQNLSEDGIHLNEKGHEKIFKKLIPYLIKSDKMSTANS